LDIAANGAFQGTCRVGEKAGFDDHPARWHRPLEVSRQERLKKVGSEAASQHNDKRRPVPGCRSG
jgi:hypothetical protein